MNSSSELIHNIIDTDQRRSLIEYWNKGEKIYDEVTEDGLGIKVESLDIPPNDPVMKTISDYVRGSYIAIEDEVSRVEDVTGPLHQRSSYILNYRKGSYMRPHLDNDGVHLTCVTLLGASKDLYGGIPFFVDDKDQGKIFSAQILPGQSLIYPRHMRHGVSVIEKGSRLVLVSWFGKKQKTI